MLAKDGTVIHCLPGYWNPNDLDRELDLADRLHRVWLDGSITEPQKKILFAQEQVRHIQSHPHEETERSELQGFDKHFVVKNNVYDAIANRSLIPADYHDAPKEAFKTTDVIVHERLANQPFVNYANFNIAQFVNYGSHHYDKHEKDLEPETMANVRAHSLREVLHETAEAPPKPEKTATAASATPPAQYPNPLKPQDTQKLMVDGFWAYAKQGNWAKAKRVAEFMVSKQPDKPTGHEMKAVIAYSAARYAEAYFHSCNAIRLGSKHPRIVAIYRQTRTMTTGSR